MSVRDLRLFESCKGSVLRGTLVTAPLMMTGATTFLQDRRGDIIQLGLYNLVPGKMSRLDGFKYVRKHLRKGTRVSIAEPFLKIFYDGGRGIRVDDPRELRFESDDDQVTNISSYREEGNAFYNKKMYLAAIESYTTGLNKDTLVPTVLSNRAQAYIMLNNWPQAIADSAASLSIRPDCEKTRKRYNKALEMTSKGDVSELLRNILEPSNWNREEEVEKSAEALKSDGNTAFKRGNYTEAIELYTLALLASNKVVRTMLGNWAAACLELELYHEALAAAAASLRIWVDPKSVFRVSRALIQVSFCS